MITFYLKPRNFGGDWKFWRIDWGAIFIAPIEGFFPATLTGLKKLHQAGAFRDWQSIRSDPFLSRSSRVVTLSTVLFISLTFVEKLGKKTPVEAV